MADARATHAVRRSQFDKHGAPLSRKFDLPALAKVTEGYSSGDMDRIVQMVATPRRIERLHEGA